LYLARLIKCKVKAYIKTDTKVGGMPLNVTKSMERGEETS